MSNYFRIRPIWKQSADLSINGLPVVGVAKDSKYQSVRETSKPLALTAGGIALGAAAALGLTRLLGNLLYKVSPRDPLAFGSAVVVMTIASLAVCFLPAWRATQTDRARALRD